MATRSQAAKKQKGKGENLDLDVDVKVRTMRVVVGEEVFQPIQFNGFRVGACELEVEVPPNEDVAVVYARVRDALEAMQRNQFERKLEAWAERVEEAAGHVRR